VVKWCKVTWIHQNYEWVTVILAVIAILIAWFQLRKKEPPSKVINDSPNQTASTFGDCSNINQIGRARDIHIHAAPPTSVAPEAAPSVAPTPRLMASTFSTDFISSIQKSVFLVHVRNDAISPLATARNVVAHIGYKRQDGHGMQVDCGAWIENAIVINIERGQTKHLIVAITDEGKNFAVDSTGPRNNFTDPRLLSVGELTAGQWMMIVVINAENYTETFRFLLTIEQIGAIKCQPVKQSLW
jgi:hypothetical protein